MSEFYTCVDSKNDKIYLTGYRNGKKFKETIDYKPYLFSPTKSETPYKTIWNKPVKRLDFQSINDARGYVNQQKKMGADCYGLTDYKFVHLYDRYSGSIEYDFSLINVVAIDIENDSKGGFADVDLADREITAITLARRDGDRVKSITFGMFPYETDSDDKIYIHCRNEEELLWSFLKIWRTKAWLPDIITGWNNKFFDLRYIINRMKRVLPENTYHKLSPFNWVSEYQVNQRDGKSFSSYTIFGISTVDYYEIYKKFAAGERENYKLDFILQYELGERKTDYSKYGSLAKLYEANKPLFYEYNIQDTTSILRLEDKIHYIEQVVTMAYICKVNYDNMVKTVKPWDVLVHNYLMDRKIVVPFYEEADEEDQIMGGYCKPPKPDVYNYVISLDFTSLYPSIALSCNISPEMLVGQTKKLFNLDVMVSPNMEQYTKALVDKDYAMTINGCFFRRTKRGFLPEIMKYFFDERKKFRKLESKAEEEYLLDKDNTTKRNIFLRYKNLQTAYKLINNSGYGAVANRYFRWFDNRLAEGITATGQTSAKYVAYYLNIFLNKTFNTVDKDYVIYQDTDSAYINVAPFATAAAETEDGRLKAMVEFTETVIQPEVDRICANFCEKLNVFENNLSMKFETACDKTFFIAKKRYVLRIPYKEGLWLPKSKLKITGLEPVRSTVPKVTREAMKTIINLVFEGKQDEIHTFIINFKKKFFEMGFEDIGAPSSVKGLDKYSDENDLYKKGTPAHVKGSLFYNRYLREKGLDKDHELIYNHDKVKYCHLRPANPTHQPVICVKADYPKDWDLEQYIDYEAQWQKTFLSPIENIFVVVKFSTEKQPDLMNCFE